MDASELKAQIIQQLLQLDGYGRLWESLFAARDVHVSERNSSTLVVDMLGQGLAVVPLSPEQKQKIRDAVFSLDEREADIILSYFGIDKNPETLGETALRLKIGRERVRQIKEIALRRLRHLKRGQALRDLAVRWIDFQNRCLDLEKLVAHLQTQLEDRKDMLAQYEAKVKAQGHEHLSREIRVKAYEHVRIDQLELSVRSDNCLRCMGIETIGALCQYTERQLLEYRNFGRKSLLEIKEILDKFGLSLRQN